MRLYAFALVALVMAGCNSMPTQPAPSEFQTQFLNLASIASQYGTVTNVAPNTQVNVPIQIAPVTQISALSFGNQTANPLNNLAVDQGINVNTAQFLDQFQAAL